MNILLRRDGRPVNGATITVLGYPLEIATFNGRWTEPKGDDAIITELECVGIAARIEHRTYQRRHADALVTAPPHDEDYGPGGWAPRPMYTTEDVLVVG